jgi:hypothetical protein
MSRSICELACEVQASGLCTPDWVGAHAADLDLYYRLRITENPPQAWAKLCRLIEGQRHFLFDELPNVTSRGLWNDPAAALADYSRRVGQPELPQKVQQLWN